MKYRIYGLLMFQTLFFFHQTVPVHSFDPSRLDDASDIMFRDGLSTTNAVVALEGAFEDYGGDDYEEESALAVAPSASRSNSPTISTDELTTEAPTTEASAVEEPTTEASAVEEPTTESSAGEEPTTEASAVEEPTTEASAVEEPTTEASAGEEPTTEASAVEEPTTEASAAEEPTTGASEAEEPTTEASAGEEPTTGASDAEEPTTEASAGDEPTTGASDAEEPTTEASAAVEPTTEASAGEEQTTGVSAAEEPTTEASAAVEPTTEQAGTVKPASDETTTEETGEEESGTEEQATPEQATEELATEALTTEESATEGSEELATDEPATVLTTETLTNETLTTLKVTSEQLPENFTLLPTEETDVTLPVTTNVTSSIGNDTFEEMTTEPEVNGTITQDGNTTDAGAETEPTTSMYDEETTIQGDNVTDAGELPNTTTFGEKTTKKTTIPGGTELPPSVEETDPPDPIKPATDDSPSEGDVSPGTGGDVTTEESADQASSSDDSGLIEPPTNDSLIEPPDSTDDGRPPTIVPPTADSAPMPPDYTEEGFPETEEQSDSSGIVPPTDDSVLGPPEYSDSSGGQSDKPIIPTPTGDSIIEPPEYPDLPDPDEEPEDPDIPPPEDSGLPPSDYTEEPPFEPPDESGNEPTDGSNNEPTDDSLDTPESGGELPPLPCDGVCDPDIVLTIGKSSQFFGSHTYRVIRKTHSRNVAFSPVSIQMALLGLGVGNNVDPPHSNPSGIKASLVALVMYLGKTIQSLGHTLSQTAIKVLGPPYSRTGNRHKHSRRKARILRKILPDNTEDLEYFLSEGRWAEIFYLFLHDLEHKQKLPLYHATGYYADIPFKINSTAQRILNRINFTFENVDFEGNDVNTIINEQIEEKTDGIFQSVLDSWPHSFSSETSLFVANVFAMDLHWKKPFYFTYSDYFYTNREAIPAKVEMLHQTDYFNISEIKYGKVIQLPFNNEDFAFFAIIPKNMNKGLEDIEKNLKNIIDNIDFTESYVDVFIPIFYIEKQYTLADLDQNIDGGGNLVSIFQKHVFSNLAKGSQNFTLSDILLGHKIKITARGMGSSDTNLPKPQKSGKWKPSAWKTFTANQPFVYFVQHIPSKAILSIGRYCDPTPDDRSIY